MNLAAVDLNLLLAFEALVSERSVTRAATRLGLSQPAMSHALARLRGLFRDPMFTRAGQSMIPTTRTRQLAGPILEALAQIRRTVEEPACFDPKRWNHTFSLAATDYGEMIALPRLFSRLETAAPGVKIKVRRLPAVFEPPEADLRSGAVDLALGFFPELPSPLAGLYAQPVFEEPHVCIARLNHPNVGKRLSLKQFAQLEHVGIFYREEGPGIIDNILAKRGLRRRLALSVPHFLTVPGIVAQTNLIATVPRRLAESFSAHLPLRILKPPIDMPVFCTTLVWHERTHSEAPHHWLRQQLWEVCRNL